MPRTRCGPPWRLLATVLTVALVGPPGLLAAQDEDQAVGSATSPTWSPDGAHLAFDGLTSEGRQIWVVPAQGGALVQVTQDPDCLGEPDWSRTGKIAYVSKRTGTAQIWQVNSDGTGERQLTSSPYYNSEPSWSPDGTNIAFWTRRGSYAWVATISAQGQEQALVAKRAACPAWSPDGNRVAFCGSGDNIWVKSLQTGALARVTYGPYLDTDPAWSPNGSQIAFVSDRERPGNPRIWIVNADGTNLHTLLDAEEAQYDPAWSPDGAKIAFSMWDGEADNIWVVNSDGTGLTQVTHIQEYGMAKGKAGVAVARRPSAGVTKANGAETEAVPPNASAKAANPPARYARTSGGPAAASSDDAGKSSPPVGTAGKVAGGAAGLGALGLLIAKIVRLLAARGGGA